MTNAIEVRALRKSFGRTRALDGLDLFVRTGEVHAFLGPNGAGKTTTIRILLGLLRKDGGEASLLGGDPWRDAVRLHARLAYVPGDVTLWPALTGGEIIDLLARLRGPAVGHRPQAQGRADRAVRPGSGQEGAGLLQGQPAEGGADRGAGQRRRAAAVRRADGRARPADGGELPRMRQRGAARRPHRAAVQPHPGRGGGAVGPGDDHPRRPGGRDRHAGRDAAPDPDDGRSRAGRPGQPGRPARRPRGGDRRARGCTPRWITPR